MIINNGFIIEQINELWKKRASKEKMGLNHQVFYFVKLGLRVQNKCLTQHHSRVNRFSPSSYEKTTNPE